MKRTMIAVSLMAAAGLSVNAAAKDSAFYVGGNVGWSDIHESPGMFPSVLTASGLTGTFTAADTELGFKVYAGYRLNKYLSAEFGYNDFASVDYRYIITAPTGTSGVANTDPRGPGKAKKSVDGLYVYAIPSFPVSERFSVFAKLGILNWDEKFKMRLPTLANLARKDDGFNFAFGVGARFDVTDSISVRAEWDRTTGLASTRPQLFSAGVEIRF